MRRSGTGLFCLESLDNTVRTPEQAELVSGLPTLGVVPQFLRADAARLHPAKLSLANSESASRRAELIAQLRPNSEAAECYRSLRTSILLSALDSPPKVLLVTSPLPQEGKTTTSVNCAIVLAQRGSRVLLVDADLRRPGVHRAFGFDRKGGLSTVLAGTTTMESVIKTYPASSKPAHLAGRTAPSASRRTAGCKQDEVLDCRVAQRIRSRNYRYSARSFGH